MTRRRWIADEVSDNQAALTGEHALHLIRVLRARVGQEFDVVANGELRSAKIAHIEEQRVEFDLGEPAASASLAQITVVLSIFKFDRMEWAIEKCTELGAACIVPAMARRTETHLATAAVKRVERWRRVARQAAEQSRRISTPEITAPMRIDEVAALAAGTRIVLDESEHDAKLSDYVSAETSTVALAFGPEGGWTQEELKLFHDGGWKSASLGPTILRAETASIAALAVVIASLNA
jgi:16S rRNA (uracil1498-N3)-methyltransferase